MARKTQAGIQGTLSSGRVRAQGLAGSHAEPPRAQRFAGITNNVCYFAGRPR